MYFAGSPYTTHRFDPHHHLHQRLAVRRILHQMCYQNQNQTHLFPHQHICNLYRLFPTYETSKELQLTSVNPPYVELKNSSVGGRVARSSCIRLPAVHLLGRDDAIIRNMSKYQSVKKNLIFDLRLSNGNTEAPVCKAETTSSTLSKCVESHEQEENSSEPINAKLKIPSLLDVNALRNEQLKFMGHQKWKFPQDSPYFCTPCWKGYNTERMFKKHLENHIQCPESECKFSAVPYVLAKHILNVHSVSNCSSSVKVDAKWKEARTKHYPTSAHIAEKAQLEKEKVLRGEVLVTENSLKHKGTTLSLEAMKIKGKYKFDGAEKGKKNSFKCKKRKTAELLEKLLENEIRHEENVLLQCIRHVCSTIINYPKSETIGKETNF
ncbi:Nuclear fragile X mental retardation-interacting protein 1 [Trichinella pseudospiralis]|uniref:Nuclear fragile X mental retardation-interacting protein 1 n=1 Tax=Trichinella pseudospiralis TaxID=6337 RepID=A0A0V0Y087_TRIPS|nr:Nuclear fragile X mental retardation-interacting protein 1 [Trichinella pseudospiralis]